MKETEKKEERPSLNNSQYCNIRISRETFSALTDCKDAAPFFPPEAKEKEKNV